MKKCVNCTYTTDNDEKFCPSCGGELVVEATAEVVSPAPEGGKAKKIIGLIASILALYFAGGCLISAFIPVYGVPTFIFNGILALILAVVGLILSWKSSKAGKIIGIIAIVLLVLAVILGVVLGGGLVFLGMLGSIISLSAGF